MKYYNNISKCFQAKLAYACFLLSSLSQVKKLRHFIWIIPGSYKCHKDPLSPKMSKPHPVLKANSFLTFLLSITSADRNLNFGLKTLSYVRNWKQAIRRGTFKTLLNPFWIMAGSFRPGLLIIVYRISESNILEKVNS